MKTGVYVRNMGPVSDPDTIDACARAAEDAGIDSIWVVDHIAIPPDDAEGSGGRYLDPLATLAYLAAATKRVEIGVAVLVVPYRPAFATAKWIATIQELSRERLNLGVGVGWMRPEFAVAGADRSRRGADTDAFLEKLDGWFSDDVGSHNGVEFLFLPRPRKPPVYVGGGEAAIRRALRFDAGWMPMAVDPAKLEPGFDYLRAEADKAGKTPGPVLPVGGLDTTSKEAARGQMRALVSLGCEGFVSGFRYEGVDEFKRSVDALVEAAAGS